VSERPKSRRPSRKREATPRRGGRRATWSPEDPSARPRVEHFPAAPSLPAMVTVGDLRRALEETGATWSVSDDLKSSDPVPVRPLGGIREDLIPAEAAPAVDWAEVMAVPPRNPFLLRRAIRLKLVSPEAQEITPLPPTPPRPRKTTAKTTTAKKTTAKKTTAKKTTAEKTTAKTSTAKRTTARKTTVKKTTSRRPRRS
jgi:hypothetical protein